MRTVKHLGGTLHPRVHALRHLSYIALQVFGHIPPNWLWFTTCDRFISYDIVSQETAKKVKLKKQWISFELSLKIGTNISPTSFFILQDWPGKLLFHV